MDMLARLTVLVSNQVFLKALVCKNIWIEPVLLTELCPVSKVFDRSHVSVFRSGLR